jgi:hypothetical protein
MERFINHTQKCSQCAPSYSSRTSLCNKGIPKAKDVVEYVRSNGEPYSVVDSKDNKSVFIEIPPKDEPVRELLKAIEYGMQLDARLNKPIIH